MRINKFVALATGMSRRAADEAIEQNRVKVNAHPAIITSQIASSDVVTLDGKVIKPLSITTIMLNKPAGYVCSRNGQGSKTIYDLIPQDLYHLKPVGRLDKDSSGLLLMTNDGTIAHEMTHPSQDKVKKYYVKLDKKLAKKDYSSINNGEVILEDGKSQLQLSQVSSTEHDWLVSMREGRNRQIRRTFDILGYNVKKLHRLKMGNFSLDSLPSGKWSKI